MLDPLDIEVVDECEVTNDYTTLPGDIVRATSTSGIEWEWHNPVRVEHVERLVTTRKPWEVAASAMHAYTVRSTVNGVEVVTASLTLTRKIDEPSKNLQKKFSRRVFCDVFGLYVGSSRVDLQACKLEYSIVSPK